MIKNMLFILSIFAIPASLLLLDYILETLNGYNKIKKQYKDNPYKLCLALYYAKNNIGYNPETMEKSNLHDRFGYFCGTDY
jgi:hypothetical protein